MYNRDYEEYMKSVLGYNPTNEIYNNTYNSKSSSSKNKITLESIEKILSAKGELTVFEKPYQYFNAGKTKLDNHKEFIFISKIRGK